MTDIYKYMAYSIRIQVIVLVLSEIFPLILQIRPQVHRLGVVYIHLYTKQVRVYAQLDQGVL